MRATEILLEGSEDILKSFFSLAKGDGKFKSEKQRDFLLSKCNAGNGVFRLGQNLSFGEHGGASAKVTWTVFCDDTGVLKINKETGSKGEILYWERTPKQMAKQRSKAKLHHEEVVRQYSNDKKMFIQQKAETEQKIVSLEKEWEDSPIKKTLLAKGLDDIVQDLENVHQNKLQVLHQTLTDLKVNIDRCDQYIQAAHEKLKLMN